MAGIKPHNPTTDAWRERHGFRLAEALPWLTALAVFVLLPDRLTFGTGVLIMVLFALSLDLILGYAGILTLGHAAFYGIGAYTIGLLVTRAGWNEPISGLFAAAIIAGFFGLVSGWLLLRYRGFTLLMLTLTFCALLMEFGKWRTDLTGGYDGLPGMSIAPLLGIFDYDLYGKTSYLYALAVLFVVFLILRRIVRSPFGLALTGIRENAARMHALGAPVHRHLVTAYTISAAIAGIAGALFAQSTAYVTLGVFEFERSAAVLVVLILGGAGRLYGAFIGALIYMALEDSFAKWSPGFWQFGIGLLLVLTMLFARRGLLGLAEDIARRILKAKRP